MKISEATTKHLLNLMADKYDGQWCSFYGEPGYQNPEQGIVFANWNKVPKNIGNYLEAAGFELEWSDEWVIDYDYNKAYRCSPNSYDWEPSFRYTERGDMLTPDDSDINDWISEHENEPHKVLPSFITGVQLIALGYEKYGDAFESGLHQGMNDDPQKIYKQVQDEFKPASVVFRMADTSQFYITFECWYRLEEEEEETDEEYGQWEYA
jgi:hypothetical protein